MKIKIISSVIIAAFMLAFLAFPASADFRVSPDIIDATVEIGNNSLSSINVANETDQPEDFKVILAGYGQATDGSTRVLDQDSNPLSAIPYLKFTPTEFHLDPGEKQSIDLSASIPAGVNGGRYAVLLVVTEPNNDGNVNTITRLGIPISLTVANSQIIKKGSAKIIVPSEIVPAKPISVTVNYANEGNIHYKVHSDLTISNAQGEILAKLSIGPAMVLPGYSRDLTAEWTPENELSLGKYNISAQVYLDDGSLIAGATGSFEVKEPYVPPQPPATITLKPSSAATINTDDGRISISFPQGSVLGETQISLQSCPPDQLPAPPLGLKLAATCFRVDGLTGLLVKDAKITVKYSSADLDQAGGDASRLQLARWDEASNNWTILKTTVDKSAMTLTATSNQFSLWAVTVGTPSPSTPPFNWKLYALIGGLAVLLIAGFILITKRRRV